MSDSRDCSSICRNRSSKSDTERCSNLGLDGVVVSRPVAYDVVVPSSSFGTSVAGSSFGIMSPMAAAAANNFLLLLCLSTCCKNDALPEVDGGGGADCCCCCEGLGLLRRCKYVGYGAVDGGVAEGGGYLITKL